MACCSRVLCAATMGMIDFLPRIAVMLDLKIHFSSEPSAFHLPLRSLVLSVVDGEDRRRLHDLVRGVALHHCQPPTVQSLDPPLLRRKPPRSRPRHRAGNTNHWQGSIACSSFRSSKAMCTGLAPSASGTAPPIRPICVPEGLLIAIRITAPAFIHGRPQTHRFRTGLGLSITSNFLLPLFQHSIRSGTTLSAFLAINRTLSFVKITSPSSPTVRTYPVLRRMASASCQVRRGAIAFKKTPTVAQNKDRQSSPGHKFQRLPFGALPSTNLK